MEESVGKDLTASLTINLARKITTGGHSDVYRGRLALGGDGNSIHVAVKVPRYNAVTDKVIRNLNNEIALWSKLNHPNVLPFLGTCLLNEAEILPGAVSPWCDDGTIIEYLKSARDGHTNRANEPLEDGSFALLRLEVKLLSQVTDGLEYLHGQNIIHGDLKGGNILVQDGIARLSDFGYSVIVAERVGSTSSHLGTSRWFAPEFLESGAHRTREADMWALGCVILEIRTLLVPWYDHGDVAVPTALYSGGQPYDYPDYLNTKLWHIATHCWCRYSENRPTSQAINTYLKDMVSSLEVLTETIVLAGDLPLTKRPSRSIATLLWLGVAQICQDAELNLGLGLSRVRRVIDALEGLGDRYRPTLVRHSARAMALRDAGLADELMAKLSSANVGSPIQGDIEESVTSVAFLADNRRLISSASATVHIWDIQKGGTVISLLDGHTKAVSCVAVHGVRVASCSDDGTFRVWDADSGKLVLGPTTAHNRKAVHWIAYSRDGTRIATAGDNSRAILWDAITGVRVFEMIGHTQPITCVAFSQDGTRLVSGSMDHMARIWDAASGKSIGQPLTGHARSVHAVCFSPDGKRVFSSSADATIRIWDAEMRKLLINPLRMDDTVLCMALSPDGQRLISGSQSGRITMWDTETGAQIPTPFNLHQQAVYSLTFSPDGHKIASASNDTTIGLWDATDDWKRYELGDDGKHLVELLRSEIPPTFSNKDLLALSSLIGSDYGRDTLCSIHVDVGFPDTRATALRLLASLSAQLAHDGSSHSPSAVDAAHAVITTIEALDVRLAPPVLRRIARALARHDMAVADEFMAKLSSPELRPQLRVHTKSPSFSSVAFLADGGRLVSSWNNTLSIWDIRTGERVFGPLAGHTMDVCCVAVHGSRIATCSDDGTFRIWDADSVKLVLGPITAHQGKKVNSIAYSGDGTRIATAGHDDCAVLWDASRGVLLSQMVGHTARAICVAFSADGRRLVSGSEDKTARIWDLVSGSCTGEPLTGHTDWVRAVCFSPDGRRVYSSSDDNTIRIWDAKTRTLLFEPIKIVGRGLSMALSPDGTRLVSGTETGSVAIWDAETGTAMQTPFKGHDDWVWALAFSPDGRRIVSTSADNTIVLRDATDDWKQHDIDDEIVETDHCE